MTSGMTFLGFSNLNEGAQALAQQLAAHSASMGKCSFVNQAGWMQHEWLRRAGAARRELAKTSKAHGATRIQILLTAKRDLVYAAANRLLAQG